MKKMRKIFGAMMIAVIALVVMSSVALAAGPRTVDSDGVRDLINDGAALGRGTAYGFVDEDGDGVNDRYTGDPLFVDEDGDGVCDLVADGEMPAFAYGNRVESATAYGYQTRTDMSPGPGRGYRLSDGSGLSQTGVPQFENRPMVGGLAGDCPIQ